MKGQAVYIYGFAGEFFDIPEYEGIDERNNVYIEDYDGIYAVESKVELDEFGSPYIDENLENVSWLKNKARIHMDVIKNVMEYTQIIPLKFCTIFYDDSKIKEFVMELKDKLIENLSSLQGKEEWSCKMYWDKKGFLNNYMNEEKEKDKENMTNMSEGAAYFLKKKLEINLNKKAINKVNFIIGKVTDTLKDLVLEVKSNKILAKELTEREEDMVMNLSLLIDYAEKDLFLEKMNELSSKVRGHGLILKLSGPWPPYNFVENLK
ncbi:MAG: hypothetical protein A2Y22_04235 [Clostridiales bacterium GWD2_32_59]|nr:MAG: hypothetical protein A2Y22_04235 [Clostridiales bacterium GWD2_32_59]